MKCHFPKISKKPKGAFNSTGAFNSPDTCNKKIYISGDFNFDLLKSTSHPDTADFYNKMSSNLLLPSIIIPTKINTKNDTLIDNIFSNQVNPDLISGNLTVNFSDGHLPSFVIIPKPNQNHVPKKQSVYEGHEKL